MEIGRLCTWVLPAPAATLKGQYGGKAGRDGATRKLKRIQGKGTDTTDHGMSIDTALSGDVIYSSKKRR